MLVVFQGNELSVGIIISQWLLGTAIGNFIASRLAPANNNENEQNDTGNSLLGISYILSAVILFLVFFLPET